MIGFKLFKIWSVLRCAPMHGPAQNRTTDGMSPLQCGAGAVSIKIQFYLAIFRQIRRHFVKGESRRLHVADRGDKGCRW